MTSFGKLGKTPLFFFPLEKKLKAADRGKKLKRILLSSHAWLDKR
jgi:hypothetical protein